jgi:hypothetical protein
MPEMHTSWRYRWRYGTSPNLATSERVRLFAILDDRTNLEHPLGEALDVLLTRGDAERFIAEVRGDDAEPASHLRIEERGALTPAPEMDC